jgi:DNA processing protein
LAVLVGVEGLGPATLGRLLARVGSPAHLLELAAGPAGRSALLDVGAEADQRFSVDARVADGIVRAAADAPAILDRIRAAGLALVSLADPGYPARLRQIELPPHVLFVAGDPVALRAERAFAVVGTRRPTEAGRRLAARIGATLARHGATVMSGLAVGIDGEALYPRVHARLADSIARLGGAVISEFAPDVNPTTGTFPRRNRLISGLSEATVVIEAGARSGALTTAAWALEQGRGCFLVPGSIDAPMSAGCLAFLREFPGEARIVTGLPQLIEDLGLMRTSGDAGPPGRPGSSAEGRVRARSRPRAPAAAAVLSALGAAERRVAAGLLNGLATVDELVAATDLPVATVLATLSLLEDRGLVASGYGRFRPTGSLAGGWDGPGPVDQAPG